MIVEQNIWFIAKNNDNSIIHYGFAGAGTDMSVGQPIIETFNNEQDYLNRLIELNVNLE